MLSVGIISLVAGVVSLAMPPVMGLGGWTVGLVVATFSVVLGLAALPAARGRARQVSICGASVGTLAFILLFASFPTYW